MRYIEEKLEELPKEKARCIYLLPPSFLSVLRVTGSDAERPFVWLSQRVVADVFVGAAELSRTERTMPSMIARTRQLRGAFALGRAGAASRGAAFLSVDRWHRSKEPCLLYAATTSASAVNSSD